MTRGLWAWLAVIAAGVTLEGVGLATGDTDEWPTLSHVIRRHAPRWALACGIGWLGYHFLDEAK